MKPLLTYEKDVGAIERFLVVYMDGLIVHYHFKVMFSGRM